MEAQSQISSGQVAAKIYPPLEHFDYAVLDAQCKCFICHDWRTKYSALLVAQQAAVGHPITCKCGDNAPRRHRANYRCDYFGALMVARSAYFAANNRRDLYCESSWHASRIDDYNNAFDETIAAGGSGMAVRFMHWVAEQFPARRDGWWEITAPYLPLSSWIERFTLAAAASGIGASGACKVALRP